MCSNLKWVKRWPQQRIWQLHSFCLFFVCVVGVLFLLKARYQVTKQCSCSRVLSGCLLLASRVGLKAFLYGYTQMTVPQFRLRYRSRYLIYTMLWQWWLRWEITLSTYWAIMRILLCLHFSSSCSYLCPSYGKYCVFEGVVSICKPNQFPTVEIMTRRSVRPIVETLGTCRYCMQAKRSFISIFSERDGRKW